MGAWGYGIRQDDFVLDVVGAFEGLLKAGHGVIEATLAMQAKFASAIADADDGPLFWIAIADVQWTYGALDLQVLQHVQEDFDSERGLERWRDDERGLLRRRSALEAFVKKIVVPNPRPKRLPTTIVRAPHFQPGDCLSVRLMSGQYAAALVLAADHSNVEYGTNLVGVLDYLSDVKPDLDVFHGRRWFVAGGRTEANAIDVAWYHYMGFRAVKSRIELIGRIDIRNSDPKDSNTFRRWTGIAEEVLSRR